MLTAYFKIFFMHEFTFLCTQKARAEMAIKKPLWCLNERSLLLIDLNFQLMRSRSSEYLSPHPSSQFDGNSAQLNFISTRGIAQCHAMSCFVCCFSYVMRAEYTDTKASDNCFYCQTICMQCD